MKRRIAIITVITMICMAGCGQTPAEKIVETAAQDTAVDTTAPTDAAADDSSSDSAGISDAVTAAASAAAQEAIAGYNRFELQSASLHDGKWDDVISNTELGNNVSPQLSWQPVEGAEAYVVYMVDLNMQYFMHWKSDLITDTDLPEGWAESGYVGPYPPKGGEHTYDIFVLALKRPVERVKGGVDGANVKFPSFIEALDTDPDGNTGNILGCGYLSGNFGY